VLVLLAVLIASTALLLALLPAAAPGINSPAAAAAPAPPVLLPALDCLTDLASPLLCCLLPAAPFPLFLLRLLPFRRCSKPRPSPATAMAPAAASPTTSCRCWSSVRALFRTLLTGSCKSRLLLLLLLVVIGAGTSIGLCDVPPVSPFASTSSSLRVGSRYQGLLHPKAVQDAGPRPLLLYHYQWMACRPRCVAF
jgi:hypothetical protein